MTQFYFASSRFKRSILSVARISVGVVAYLDISSYIRELASGRIQVFTGRVPWIVEDARGRVSIDISNSQGKARETATGQVQLWVTETNIQETDGLFPSGALYPSDTLYPQG